MFSEGKVKCLQVGWDEEAGEETEKDKHLVMSDVLEAFIGASYLPTTCTSGVVYFMHTEQFKNSYVNTCSPSLCLTRIRELQSYDSFKDAMYDIIVGSPGFGQR